MTNDLLNLSAQSEYKPSNYFKALSDKSEIVWNQLQNISVKQALEIWYQTLPGLTKRNYQSGFNRIIELGLLNADANLQNFALVNHSAKI